MKFARILFTFPLAIAVTVAGGISLNPASAGPVMKINSFTETPVPIPNTGGTLSLSATVQAADTCTFSTSSIIPVGLPATVGCQSGIANAQVSIPVNSGAARSFTFKLTATTGKKSITKYLVVKQQATLKLKQISTGAYSTCALLANKTVSCWGANNWGQLGIGSHADTREPTVPVTGLANVTAISGGSGDFFCALIKGGTVKCWGSNMFGNLGDGTTNNSSTPVAVTGLANVTAISTVAENSCALILGGTVKCWGSNNFGQLGDGTTNNSSSPVDVTGLPPRVIAISVGWRHTCALIAGGSVRCWGDNNHGELGDGTTNNSSTPVAVTGLVKVTALSLADVNSCALIQGGTVKCWGVVTRYPWTVYDLTPVVVAGLANVTAISSSGPSACALIKGGAVKCWGDNTFGELGNSTFQFSATPVDVTGLANATAISATTETSCALLAGGTAVCWGRNSEGEFGHGNSQNEPFPVAVNLIGGP